jgi:hypothetical protein
VTLAEPAWLLDAEPKWVLNALAVLERRAARYSLSLARRLSQCATATASAFRGRNRHCLWR